MNNEYQGLYISPYFYKLMSLKKDFMYIPSEDNVYIGEEWEKWNERHGLTDPTPRYFFKYITDKHGRTGYAIKGTEQIKTLMIPYELIKLSV